MRKDVDQPTALDHSNLTSSAGVIPGTELPVALDWSFLQPGFGLTTDAPEYMRLDDLAGQPGPGFATPISGADLSRLPEDGAKTSEPRPAPPNSKSHCTQELARIMLDLDIVWVSLPPKSGLHFPLSDDLEKHTAAFAEKHAQHTSLELLFGACQRLVDLYPTAISQSLALNLMDPRQCESDGCLHSADLPASLRAIEESVQLRNSPSTLDLSLASLLASCHLRLLDVLDHLVFLVLSCFRLHVASPTIRDPDFGVPVLRVGSFTPTRASAAFMQAFLVKHLLGTLSEKAGQFAQAVESKAGVNRDTEFRALLLQCEVLKERQTAKLDHISTISEELVKVGMLK